MDVPDLSVIRLEQTLFVGFCSTKCQDLFSGILTVRPRPADRPAPPFAGALLPYR
jgi:hypothetical protein